MSKLSTILASFAIAGTANADFSFEPKPINTPPPAHQAKGNTVHFTASNHVVLAGDINGVSVANTMMNLAALKTANPILFIYSGGGDVHAGLRLVDMILSSPKEITCVAYYAASMAFITLQACHKRYVMMDSVIMQHQAMFRIGGSEAQFQSYTNFIFRVLDKVNTAQAKRMRTSVEAFNKARHDDLWIFGEEALTWKAADAVVATTCAEDLLLETKKEPIQTMFGEIELEFSKCPIIVDPVRVNFKNVYSEQDKHALYEKYLGSGKRNMTQPVPFTKETPTTTTGTPNK